MSRPSKSSSRLDAGPFGRWLAEAVQAIDGKGKADVACGDCTACCRSSQFIHVDRNETRTLAQIPVVVLFPIPGGAGGDRVLGYDEHGRCPMLVEQECSIYPDRPATCRTYDCRVFPAAGLLPTETPLIAEQARRWRFEYPAEDDREKHRAVEAAARFLRGHPEVFARGRIVNTTRLAVSALRVHPLFIGRGAGDDKHAPVTLDEEALIAAIRAKLGHTTP